VDVCHVTDPVQRIAAQAHDGFHLVLAAVPVTEENGQLVKSHPRFDPGGLALHGLLARFHGGHEPPFQQQLIEF
jgi:hypothetical protein